MERLVYKDGSVWRHIGRAQDHIAVLYAADGLYRRKLTRVGYRRRHGHDLPAIQMCWDSGLLNLTQLSDITGVTRLSLRRWVGDDGYARPKGKLNPAHLAVMAQQMESMLSSHYVTIAASFLQNLAQEGTKEVMSHLLLGINEDREVTISYVSDDVLPRVRPDDEGHTREGEGVGEPGHQDQADDGHDEGSVESEPDHAGELQGPPPRAEAPQPSAAEIERVRAEHRRMESAKGREDFGPPIVGEDWHPLEDFEPDKDGDSLLVRGKHTPASGLLDGIPVGQRWEQATPES